MFCKSWRFHTSVNDTGSLWCLGTDTDGPLPDLILTSGEERGKVEGLTHGDDSLGKCRLDAKLLALLLSFGLSLETTKAFFQADGDGNDGVALGVLLDPLSDLGKVLVLLTDVIPLAKVDEEDNGLSGKKEKGVDDLNL